MYEKAPIIVTGCPRSGTSLICGIVDACGAEGGRTCGPTKANPRGQYENTDIVGNCIKPFLRKLGVDPMGQDPLPDIDSVPYDPSVGKCIQERMRNQGVDIENRPWYFKSCKGALIWPAMVTTFQDAKWIIVRRNKKDIAASCLRTSFMHKYKTEEGWEQWADHHIERFREISRSQRSIQIWPEHFRGGNLLVAKDLIRWLGLTWNEQAVHSFVDMDLYRGASK